MDSESEPTRELNCWDAPNLLTPDINAWTTNTPTPDFEPSAEYSDFLIDIGFGKETCPPETRDFWRKSIRENYRGDEGRRRIRMAAINLRDRDGLHPRLSDVKCPVLWLHVGSPGPMYSECVAERYRVQMTSSTRLPTRSARSSCSLARRRPGLCPSRAAFTF